MREVPWFIRYSPKQLKDFVANGLNLDELLAHLETPQTSSQEHFDVEYSDSDAYEPSSEEDCTEKSMIFFISGPQGSGKTSLAFAIAHHLNRSVIEYNATSNRSLINKQLLDCDNRKLNMSNSVHVSALKSPKKVSPPKQPSIADFFKKVDTKQEVEEEISDSVEEIVESPSIKENIILVDDADISINSEKSFIETLKKISKRTRKIIIVTFSDENFISFGDELDYNNDLKLMNLTSLLKNFQPSYHIRLHLPSIENCVDFVAKVCTENSVQFTETQLISAVTNFSCDLRAIISHIQAYNSLEIAPDLAQSIDNPMLRGWAAMHYAEDHSPHLSSSLLHEFASYCHENASLIDYYRAPAAFHSLFEKEWTPNSLVAHLKKIYRRDLYFKSLLYDDFQPKKGHKELDSSQVNYSFSSRPKLFNQKVVPNLIALQRNVLNNNLSKKRSPLSALNSSHKFIELE